MSKRWLSILLSVSAISFLFAACKKNMSSDAPLTPSYYPSVIISSDNQIVYAVNPATGLKNWQYSLPTDTGLISRIFKPSPLVYGNRVYVTSVSSDTIYKLDSRTGTLIKKMYLPGHFAVSLPGHFFTVVATPIADGHLIYLATTNDTLYAIDTGTAAITWKYGCSGPLFSSPTIYNHGPDVFCASSDGHVFCLNKTTGPDGSTGQPIWDYPGMGIAASPIGAAALAPSFVSSPSVCPPYVYVGSLTDSTMYCFYMTPPAAFAALNPFLGLLKWGYQTGGPIASSPSTFAQRCIFGSNDFNIYCIDSQGLKIWSKPTASQVNSSPVIDNQTVYIGSYDYFLYAINILDGSEKWRYKTNGLLKSSPIAYNGSVFIGSYDGNLYGIDGSMGLLKWKYPVIGNIECSPAIEDYSGTQYNSGVSGATN